MDFRQKQGEIHKILYFYILLLIMHIIRKFNLLIGVARRKSNRYSCSKSGRTDLFASIA